MTGLLEVRVLQAADAERAEAGGADRVELVGSVETGEEVVEAVERLRPEVVIVDVRLPGVDGISVVKQISQAAPEVKTVVFSARPSPSASSRIRILSSAFCPGWIWG